ncbi:amino acid adenylation domain-containing protein (plasmid) [Bacillus sp. ZJS3]|uniref:amino acid adenylation domain-containing protein n=1 Tax=Bacillus sp. ZJS3 TaxID=2928154 RepID=UPI001FB2B313|nr:amino acid adenylation domain-containing protein [Bacillus sp. ZJS3]UOB81919.1 amino acid adenylation domain-containing protein [Bacillus sp. ZJS3]
MNSNIGENIEKISEEFTTHFYNKEKLKDVVTEQTGIMLSQVFLNKLTKRDAHISLIENAIIQKKLNQDVKYQEIQESVPYLFEGEVSKNPQKVALIYGDHEVSYEELNLKSNMLAHYLINKGVKKEDSIGIFMDRSISMIISIVAIIKAGATYVPIDLNSPLKRIEYIIKDTEMQYIISDSSVYSKIKEVNTPFIFIDKEWDYISLELTKNLDIGVNKNNLAYINYTSGTTGEPKGVCIEQKSIVRLVKNNSYIDFNSQEIFFQFAPIAFDAATFEIWGSLLNGATLVICNKPIPTVEEFKQIFHNHNVSTLWLTVGLFNLLVDEDVDVFKNIKQLIVGGDKLSIKHISKLKAAIPNLNVVNGYGPTESTTFAMTYTIKDLKKARKYNSIPIGKPISNTQVYILKENFLPCALNEIGEVYIGGDGLCRGYLNSDYLNHEKFVLNPLFEDDSELLYRTGDLAFIDSDGGDIVFAGRKDNQTKIRGYRIELSEIESQILTHSSIDNVVVIAKNVRENSEKNLYAYVIIKKGHQISSSEIRQFLQQRLPLYMIPMSFKFMERFPLTANGKIDYRKLDS